MLEHIIMTILSNTIFFTHNDYCGVMTDKLVEWSGHFGITSKQATCNLNNITSHIITEYYVGNKSYFIDPTNLGFWSDNMNIRFDCAKCHTEYTSTPEVYKAEWICE